MSPQSKPKIAQLILAAGSSSRMGRPKQILPWKDTTLIGSAIEKSLLLKEVTTYVVLGANYDLIYNEIKDLPITVLNNVDWQLGMGSSIQYGINWIQQDKLSYDAVLISLVDQPLIEISHFNDLIITFKNTSNPIVASDLGDRIGVPALFDKSIFNELATLKEDFGARHLIKKYKNQVTSIPVIEGADIDTIEQYYDMIRDESLK